jgi:hypothetical protein
MSNYIKSLLLQGTNDVGKALQGPKLQSLDNSTWKTLNDMFHNKLNKHVFRPVGTTVIALPLFRTNFPIKEGKFAAVKLLLRSISTSHCFTACISSMFCSTPGHIWSYLVIMACHCSPSALGTHFTPGGFSASALQGHSPKPVSTAGWALPCSVRTCLAQL